MQDGVPFVRRFGWKKADQNFAAVEWVNRQEVKDCERHVECDDEDEKHCKNRGKGEKFDG